MSTTTDDSEQRHNRPAALVRVSRIQMPRVAACLSMVLTELNLIYERVLQDGAAGSIDRTAESIDGLA